MINSFFRFLLKDPWRKLIALFLTVVLYLVLNDGKQREEDMNDVSLTIECADDVFLPEMDRMQRVQLTLRGSESRIKNLEKKDIYGRIKVNRKTPGFSSQIITLTPRDFTVPRGVEVVRVKPEQLLLPLEPRGMRQLPVQVDVTGEVLAGWQSKVYCDPESVSVSGPESVLRKLEKIITEPLSVQGDSRGFKKSLELVNPKPHELTLAVSSVNVSVDITRMPERILPNISLQCIESPGRELNFELGTKRVSVTVSGEQRLINEISANDVTVFVNLSDAKYAVPGEYTVALQAVLKDRKNNQLQISVEPAEIKVKSMGYKELKTTK